MRAFKIVGSAIVLAGCLAISAQAQDTAEVRRLTILTFSGPIQVPGVTLPAGKYRFEIADSNGAPHVVRVLTGDGHKLVTSFHTIPITIATRDLRDQTTLIMFAERPAGTPPAAREWFYPGRSMGEEFVYPKSMAIELAKVNHTSVAAVEEGRSAKVVRVNEPGDESKEKGKPVTESASAEPSPAPPANGPAATPEPPAPSDQIAEAQEPVASAPAPPLSAPAEQKPVGTSGQLPSPAPTGTLPRTASPLSLFELLAGLSLAAAFGLRQLRRRMSST